MKRRMVASILAFCFIFPMLLYSVTVSNASNTYNINGKQVHWDDFSSSPQECWAYANNVYNKIWGQRFSNAFNDSSNSLRNLSDSQLTLTAEHLKAYVSNAALGACLRVCNSEYLHGTDGWGHSQIIVQKDANGFTVFEGGLDASPHCREQYYTWTGYMNTNWLGGTYKYIKYIKWPGAPAYSGSITSSFYLDVNWILNGETSDNSAKFATCDVYINGSLDANDVNDYYKQWPAGTKYEIKDIKAANGYTYNGLAAGTLSGTIGNENTSVWLSVITEKKYYLDINGLLDGENSVELRDYGTCDVYVNGSKVATGVNDYYIQWPTGTSYEIKNIRASNGRVYDGVAEGSLSGKIGTSDCKIRLSFSSKKLNQIIYCSRTVQLPKRVINLYLNPSDTTRTAYFDYGPTIRSFVHYIFSDGTVMYSAEVNHNGEDMRMWFRLESDMVVSIGHTYNYRYEEAHPHAEYMECDCGAWMYTGEYRTRSDCSTCNPPKITASTYGVNLDLDSNPSATVTFTVGGKLPSRYSIWYNKANCSNVTCDWNGWINSYTESLTITATGFGEGPVHIYLYDTSNGEDNKVLIDSLDINVTVSGSEYANLMDIPKRMTMQMGYSETIPVSAITRLNNSYQFRWISSDRSIVSGEWGSWEDGRCPLTIHPTGVGQATMSIELSEIESGKVWETRNIFITVQCNHDYQSMEIKPTCTEQGYMIHTCSICNDNYLDNYSAALGHDYLDGFCTRCGAKDPNYQDDQVFRFDDVTDRGKFYFNSVYWAYEAKPQITNGLDKTHFGPDAVCTRGQVVTFLWRAAGAPEPTMTFNPFADVKEGAFYYKAVLWAVANGITNGMDSSRFAPDATCTRGQIVTFLWRFRGEPAPDSEDTGFTDVDGGAFYAKAVAWAVESKVTNGMSATTFAPNTTCTRGQIVTFLYRAMEG